MQQKPHTVNAVEVVGWKERLRATAFLRGLGCNEITLALAVVERHAHGNKGKSNSAATASGDRPYVKMTSTSWPAV